MIEETGTTSEGVAQARLEFLRDEGLRLMAAYRGIPERTMRQSIVAMVEKVAESLSNGGSPIVIEAADGDKFLRR